MFTLLFVHIGVYLWYFLVFFQFWCGEHKQFVPVPQNIFSEFHLSFFSFQFSSGFMNLELIHHVMYLFKVYNPMVYSICTELCSPFHNLILKSVFVIKEEIVHSLVGTHSPYTPSALCNYSSAFRLYNLSSLNISSKGSHTIYGILWLAYFT